MDRELRPHNSQLFRKKLESVNLGIECQTILTEWTGIFTLGDPRKGHAVNNSYLTWTSLNGYAGPLYCYLL